MHADCLFPENQEIPSALLEGYLRQKGFRHIAGTDEAGRGCLAGPVVAAAVILPSPNPVEGIKDSKLLAPSRREGLYEKIVQAALAYAVCGVEPSEIDRINIFQASLKAMRLAVEKLSLRPDFLLVDGLHRVPLFMPQRPVVKGDLHCQSIAAASILAKVTRDRMMCGFEKEFPHFRFSVHKGYPTEGHREELRRSGPTSIHRLSFTLIPDS